VIRRWILAAAVLPLVITATPPPMPIGLYQSGFGYTTAWTTGTFPVVPKIALYYSGWGYPFQAGWARIAWAHGAEVKVDMQTGYNGTTLRQVTQGASDPFLRAFAGQIRAFGHPVIVSFDQEMNGGWYSWGKQPYWYVRAYRHVYGVMHPIAPGIRFSRRVCEHRRTGRLLLGRRRNLGERVRPVGSRGAAHHEPPAVDRGDGRADVRTPRGADPQPVRRRAGEWRWRDHLLR